MERGGSPFRLFGLSNQPHGRFFGSMSPFAVIAFEAAGDDILPGFASSLDDGNNVVERQAFRGTFLPAILAGMMIPGVDVGSAEFCALKTLPDFDIFEKPENTGQLYRKADASDFPIVFGQYFDLALAKQADGAFPGYDVYGFIAGIQNQRVFHLFSSLDGQAKDIH